MTGSPKASAHSLGRIVLTEEQLRARVSELGASIAEDHVNSDLRLVTILKGGLFFIADLSRAIDLPLGIDFMAVSSYSAGVGGRVRIVKDLDDPIEGANVIVVEDIIDTGLTLHYVLRNLASRKPASLEVCTMLDKDVRRIVEIPITYRGFSIPDRFVVGYGLDYEGYFRNLPYVAELDHGSFV